uniref:SRCR domain-containing protein n=1 Tax=Amphilophus citrinellus TaxID=61819 RepID=A0A3Q0T7K6_AMPCI
SHLGVLTIKNTRYLIHNEHSVLFSAVPIRLAGSESTRCSGRVEVYHNNSWGTVCDDGWDLNDAQVVCRELNCGPALEAPRSARYGAGTGPIWLDDVTCSGSEISLMGCPHSGFGTNTCGHGQDAGVICADLIRLTGSGSTRCSGRVEIYHNNVWGTVRGNYWDLNDAQVVCRELNCGMAQQAPRLVPSDPGIIQNWLDYVSCTGKENSLTECQTSGFGPYRRNYDYYYYREIAGVICSGQVRLIGSGSTRCSGRVEIYHNNSWGTVCDDGWDLHDAAVVCRQLNCGTALKAPQSAHFGAGTGLIWFNNVTCSGNESSLTQCQHSGFGNHTCTHSQEGFLLSCTLFNFCEVTIKVHLLPLVSPPPGKRGSEREPHHDPTFGTPDGTPR